LAYRGENKKASARAWIVLVSRSRVACQGDGTGFLPRERDHLAS